MLELQLQLSPSNEYSGLIYFRIDYFDFLVVQGTLKSLLQHHSSKASVLRHSTFFIVQHSHPYKTTGKKHKFDQMKFCQQSSVSAFQYAVQACHNFSSKEQASFTFMAVVSICSDFIAQQKKVSHCFLCFPIYLPFQRFLLQTEQGFPLSFL